MTNTNSAAMTLSTPDTIPTTARVQTWTGERGTVRYFDGTWYGIQLDGERAVTEWLPVAVRLV